MRIAEIFHSVQGEGGLAGTPSVFVRTTGCNLRCWFCDTPYTSWQPEGTPQTLDGLLARVLEYDCEHVVVTGGEPLLQPEVVPLTEALARAGLFVTVETAGAAFRPVHADLISLSPKLGNSDPTHVRWNERHRRLRDNPVLVRRLLAGYDCQLKFVVDEPCDLGEVVEYLSRFPELDRSAVWVMPQGTDPEQLAQKTIWLEPAAQRLGCGFSPRLHIELYGNVRGR